MKKLFTLIIFYKIVLITILISVSFILRPDNAFSQISCGDTITESTTFTEDLTCPMDVNPALTVGASNITLDLGGHTLRGKTLESNDSTGIIGQNINGITIKNGTIDGFSCGIFLLGSSNITIRNMIFKNEEINDPEHYIAGVTLSDTHNATITNSQFEFLFSYHKDAVALYASDALIKDNISRGGAVTFSFHPICDNINSPNTAEVSNNTFTDAPFGVEVMCAYQAKIIGNKFINNSNAIQSDAPFPKAVTELSIENNVIETSLSPSIGIEFRGTLNSNISRNTITGNDAWGIALTQSLGCISEIPGWECFYSTGNTIADNLVRGNGTDLFHDTKSSPNAWENNIFDTKEGTDIKRYKISIIPIIDLLLR